MKSWEVEIPNRLLNEVRKKFLTHTLKELRWAIEHNRCFVNQQAERFCSRKVKKGDRISLWIEKPPALTKEKERILFEDSHILVYDKPPFLTSEQLARFTHTVLAHRLDRDTSGVIVLAKSPEALADIEEQFRQRSVQKEYLAVVEGLTPATGTISGNMAPQYKREDAVIWGMSKKGVWSQTHYQCLQQKNQRSLLQCFPTTGRTHQIRVHLKHIGHPIVGDYTYGTRQAQNALFRPLLHAHTLSFIHPNTKQKFVLKAAPPEEFRRFLE